MKKLYILICCLIITSCQNNVAPDLKQNTTYEAGKSPLETLKSKVKAYGNYNHSYQLPTYFMNENYEEILNTIEVVETVKYLDEDGLERYISFYKYFVGTDVYRNSELFVLRDGKYYESYAYLSTYSKDDDVKKLGKKREGWDNETEMILNWKK